MERGGPLLCDLKVSSAQGAEPLSSAVGVLDSTTGIKSSEDSAVFPLCFNLYGEKYPKMPYGGTEMHC